MARWSPKKVSSACSFCKQRKRKCSASLPCDNCVANDQTCIYGGETDGRRRDNLRRAQIALSFHQSLLYSVLDKLLEGEDEILNLLVRRRCAQGDLTEIAEYLEVPTPQSPNSHGSAVVQAIDPTNDGSGGQNSVLIRPKPCRALPTRICKRPPEVAFPGHSPHGPPTSEQSHHNTPAHESLPLNLPISSHAVTSLLTRFLNSCRHVLDAGHSPEAVLGSQKVNLDPALIGSQSCGTHFLTPAAWACAVQQKFASLDIYVRLIWIYMINQYLRWVLCSTAEQFSLLPKCMIPTSCQRQIRHHAAIDVCHLPALRDILIQRNSAECLDDDDDYIVALQVAGTRTAWEGTWDEAVTFDPELGYHTLTPHFIRTASQVESWIAGRALLRAFPQLSGHMRFAEEQETISIDDRQLYDVMGTTLISSQSNVM